MIVILLTAFHTALHSSHGQQSPTDWGLSFTPTVNRDLSLGKLVHLSVPQHHHVSNEDLQYSSQESIYQREEYLKVLNGVWRVAILTSHFGY